MDARQIGQLAEELAVSYLKKKAYQIIAQNYRIGKSEIDIIAKKRQLLVFIEVKYRNSTNFGFPEEFVSQNQKQKYYQAADLYQELEPHGELGNYLLRFDIISITKSDDFIIHHLEDAF